MSFTTLACRAKHEVEVILQLVYGEVYTADPAAVLSIVKYNPQLYNDCLVNICHCKHLHYCYNDILSHFNV